MGAVTGPLSWLADPTHWRGPEGIPTLSAQHLGLSALAVLVACLLALPVGIWLGHTGRGGAVALNVGNIGRAVPTYAVLSLLYLVISDRQTDTVVALVLFGIPPVLTNAYVAVREVDPVVVDSARGMGMCGAQVLRRVELPLATPLLMAGVRLCAVQVVATTTIAALIAGPGLGRIVTDGFAVQDQDQVVAGAAVVAVVALVVDLAMALVVRRTRRVT